MASVADRDKGLKARRETWFQKGKKKEFSWTWLYIAIITESLDTETGL